MVTSAGALRQQGLSGDERTAGSSVIGSQILQRDDHRGTVSAVRWSRDYRWLASSDTSGLVLLWNPGADRRVEKAIDTGFKQVSTLCWSPCGSQLAIAGDGESIQIRRFGGATRRLFGHDGLVRSLDWSPDGHRLVSASNDRTVKVWNPIGGNLVKSLSDHLRPVKCAKWSIDGRFLASAGSDKLVRVWDAGTLNCVLGLDGFPETIDCLDWSSSPASLLAIGGQDGSISLRDITDGQKANHEWSAHEEAVSALRWSPDGSFLLSAGRDGILRAWDPTGQQVGNDMTRHIGSVLSVDWSPDHDRVASASSDGTVRIWNADFGALSKKSGHRTETATSETYDFFISHASVDKGEIVRPLVGSLQSGGARVWYDEFELRVGDDMRLRIDKGLAMCRFGIVILSAAYLKGRYWPDAELRGLFMSQAAILPVWHKVSRDEVERFSPMLAGIEAAKTTEKSIQQISEELLARLAAEDLERTSTTR